MAISSASCFITSLLSLGSLGAPRVFLFGPSHKHSVVSSPLAPNAGRALPRFVGDGGLHVIHFFTAGLISAFRLALSQFLLHSGVEMLNPNYSDALSFVPLALELRVAGDRSLLGSSSWSNALAETGRTLGTTPLILGWLRGVPSAVKYRPDSCGTSVS